MGTANPGRLSNSKTLWVTSRPTDPVSLRSVTETGGLEKGPKRSGRFWAEPETVVPAVGGAEKEKEATAAGKGLRALPRRPPSGRGGAAPRAWRADAKAAADCSPGAMNQVEHSCRLLPSYAFRNVFKLFAVHFLAAYFTEKSGSPRNDLPRINGSSGKESACNAGDTGDAGSIPGSGRPPGKGKGNPLRDSCLENSIDRGACRVAVHGVSKESDAT